MLLEEMIKLLTSMPPLLLTDSAQRELISRTNTLAPAITLTGFNDLLISKPTTAFSDDELAQIRKYLAMWPALIRELNYLLKMIDIAWYDTHHTPMTGDDLIPVFCELLPKNKLPITLLSTHFKLASDIDKSSESTYYFMVFCIAVEQVAIDLSANRDDFLDVPAAEKYILFFKRLNHPTYFSLLNSLVTLSVLCEYHSSITNQHAAVNTCEALQGRQRLYQDLSMALARPRILSMLSQANRLHLFQDHATFSVDEFKKIYIEISDTVRDCLGLPPQKLKTLLNFFHVTSSKITLHQFIDAMSEKMKWLFEKVNEPANPVFDIPQAEQLAALLRQSF